MALRAVLSALERQAPLRLAARWDNVGLLVDHAEPFAGATFRVLLTNDLTLPVVREAVARQRTGAPAAGAEPPAPGVPGAGDHQVMANARPAVP